MQNSNQKIMVLVSYVAMVAVNFMANALPINNRSTGEISDAYSNLFAPIGATFAIWGLIYFLLGGYVLFQFTKSGLGMQAIFKKVNPFFMVSSLANILWVLAWHYDFIGISLLIMAVILISLIKIADILRSERLESWNRLWISAPFSIYFGWITVASIANATVFLVSISWNGFGIADFIWTSAILLVGALIGILRMRKDKNVLYGLVLIWAYLGILAKHLSVNGFAGEYPNIITTVVACLIVFGLYSGMLLIKKR